MGGKKKKKPQSKNKQNISVQASEQPRPETKKEKFGRSANKIWLILVVIYFTTIIVGAQQTVGSTWWFVFNLISYITLAVWGVFLWITSSYLTSKNANMVYKVTGVILILLGLWRSASLFMN